MSIIKYGALVAVAEFRNITKAANHLGYTQSGVSHLISTLESELGIPLLIRSKAGAVLTPEGAEILPYLRRVLEAEQDVRSRVADLRGVTAGKLRIGTFSSVAIHWLPQILASFRAHYPGVEVSVINGTYCVVEAALLDNSIDCGFVTLPSKEEFTVTPLIRDRLLVVAEAGHAFHSRANLVPSDLAGQTFLVPAEGSNYDVGKLFAQAGGAAQTYLNINDDYAALAMARQGLGITILPELMVRNLPMEGLISIPLRDTEREIGIAVHRRRCLSPAIRAFLDCVKEVLPTLGADSSAGLHPS